MAQEMNHGNWKTTPNRFTIHVPAKQMAAGGTSMKALQRIRASIKKRGLSGVLRKIPDSRYQQEKNKRQNQLLERQDWDLYFEATLHELARRFTHRNDLYRYFDHHFDTILGETLKSHRSYFLGQ